VALAAITNIQDNPQETGSQKIHQLAREDSIPDA